MAMMRIERMLIQCCSRLVDFYYYYYSPQLLVVDYCQLYIPFAWTSQKEGGWRGAPCPVCPGVVNPPKFK
jgi:hypothetical protein